MQVMGHLKAIRLRAYLSNTVAPVAYGFEWRLAMKSDCGRYILSAHTSHGVISYVPGYYYHELWDETLPLLHRR